MLKNYSSARYVYIFVIWEGEISGELYYLVPL